MMSLRNPQIHLRGLKHFILLQKYQH